MVPKTGERLTWAFHLWEPWIRLQSLWVSVDAASIRSPLESRPLAITPTDVHILFYHSDVTVISENQEDSIVDSEMIARDPEWQHMAVVVTFEAGNEHLIRFICDGKVVSEANREGIASNIAELLSSSVTFRVGPPNVQSFPTLFQGFRAEPGFNVFGKDFEPSLLLADTCVAVCPEGAMKLSDSSCDCAPGLFQVWYIRGLFIKQQGLIQSMEVTAYTSAGQPVEPVVGSGEVYMDFGTAMEISVVTVSAVGSAGSNTQIMMRVVSLEGKLLDVPEYQGVPIQEWTT